MTAEDAIRKRASVRSFGREIPREELITELIEAGERAPSAGNMQARRYIVACEAETVEKIRAFSPGMSGKPPVVIAILSDMDVAWRYGKSAGDWALIDAACAGENILLAATAKGLGSCMIKSYNDAALRKILAAPENFRLEMLIALGYPDKAASSPARRPIKELLRRERWS